jgi:mono/diheme cytochrome c family protein
MRRIWVIIAIFLGAIILITRCMPDNREPKVAIVNNKGEEFAGVESCRACHGEITKDFAYTQHALSSAAANEETVRGSFSHGKNVFTLNYYERVIMAKRDSGLYQMALHGRVEGESQRFDIVVGSGQGGQSYLYWKNDGLYQLPVSYYAPADSWSGSPGYNNFAINFKRPVTARCMECHSTFAGSMFPENVASNRFKKETIIYGVNCENCHGPAAKHVAYHKLHPDEKQGKFVVAPASLNRQLQLDLCGLCHSGLQEPIKPTFTFSPGDTLARHYKIDNDVNNPENLDVHGNKFALLQSSKCFLMSPSLTCSTCHNTHKNERGQKEIFAARCMSCHKNEHPGVPRVPSATSTNAGGGELSQAEIRQNCVSCHMPAKSSSSLMVKPENEQRATAAVLRTHHIAVYPEETQKLYQYIDSVAGRGR